MYYFRMHCYLFEVKVSYQFNSLHAGYFFMLLLSSADFLFKINFITTLTIRESNGLGTDQDRHSVGPDLCPNCLQRLSAATKVFVGASREEVNLNHFQNCNNQCLL